MKSDSELFLLAMIEALSAHYGSKVVVIIDEYDTPFNAAAANGFNKEAVDYFRFLYSEVFKYNVSKLQWAVLTGVMQIPKEILFSGLNNIEVDNVTTGRFGKYFGYTKEEVERMAAYFNAADKIDELEEWYDGYKMGGTSLYNPWSVNTYFLLNCVPGAHWVNTASNLELKSILGRSVDENPEFAQKLRMLMDGGEVVAEIDMNSPGYGATTPEAVLAVLVQSGYLTSLGSVEPGDKEWKLRIPNKEVAQAWKSTIVSYISEDRGFGNLRKFSTALEKGDIEGLSEFLEKILFRSASFRDTSGESFLHTAMLAFCVLLPEWRTLSQRESGDGTHDLALTPLKSGLPGIIFEFRWVKGRQGKAIETEAQNAVEQANEKRYVEELKANGVKRCVAIGIAHNGKRLHVESEWLMT